MISKFFIERPRFAAVVSIFFVLLGILAIQVLPIQEYPALTPPQIMVRTVYPGADAETVLKTVVTPLEESINGVPNMIYMLSTASSSGDVNINVYFEVGTDVNVAKMDVNNRVQMALSKLPEEVRRQGVEVRELSRDIALVVAFISQGGVRSPVEISNFVLINVVEELKRIPGVGDVVIFDDKSYSIRVWLKPDKLAKYGLTPIEVAQAIASQNQQFSAGGIAQEPTDKAYSFSYTVKGDPRFEKVSQFENIILRSNPDGSKLLLKDVATVELSSENFNSQSFYKKDPVIPVGIFLAPNANLLEVNKKAKETLKELSHNFPEDIKFYYPYDPALYVKEAIKEVIVTFVIALILVVFVIYIFLGSIKATIIPVLAIPVSIIGTFAGMYALGFSINLLTLFGLVLAIGLVVDDAIIVIENAERIKRVKRLPSKEATIEAMQEITGPIIAIVLVLSAVFIPAAFLGGFTGAFYRQFAVTIAISMILSGIVALTLTPALCARFLEEEHKKMPLPIRLFNLFFFKSRKWFVNTVKNFLRFVPIGIAVFIFVVIGTIFFIKRLPTGLVPFEDNGLLYIFTNLPPGSSLKRTINVANEISDTLAKTKEVEEWINVAGFDLQTFGSKSDSLTTFIHLKDWKERKGREHSSFALEQRLNQQFAKNREALIFVVNLPPIRGMSLVGGFEMYIQDRSGRPLSDLYKYVQEIVAKANQRPELTAVRTTFVPNVPTYKVTVDREKAKAYEVDVDEVYRTLNIVFGKYYVNDFNLYGRIFHVNLGAEGEYRDDLRDYSYVYVRSKNGNLIPISSLIKVELIPDAPILERFNMFVSAKVLGTPKPGYTSGDAIKAISEVAKEVLPPGYTIAWAGTSYQEVKVQTKGNLALIYALIFIYLILVALYESWTAPLAILLSAPFALFGAALGLNLFGLQNDVYFQAGLLVLIGLSAKNAILMVEFAEERLKRGMGLVEATIEAAYLRYRPIMMTSFAFIAGAIPLMFASGAGANSRMIIGTTVVMGMTFATLFGVFFIPLFYYVVVKLRERLSKITGRK